VRTAQAATSIQPSATAAFGTLSERIEPCLDSETPLVARAPREIRYQMLGHGPGPGCVAVLGHTARHPSALVAHATPYDRRLGAASASCQANPPCPAEPAPCWRVWSSSVPQTRNTPQGQAMFPSLPHVCYNPRWRASGVSASPASATLPSSYPSPSHQRQLLASRTPAKAWLLRDQRLSLGLRLARYGERGGGEMDQAELVQAEWPSGNAPYSAL
jgi:hypothetical protein